MSSGFSKSAPNEDHHAGYDTIEEDDDIVVDTLKQMRVTGCLLLCGSLELCGTLVLD